MSEQLKQEEAVDTMSQCAADEPKVVQAVSKVGLLVEKVMDLIGGHPWDKWLRTAFYYTKRFIPAVIALIGVVAIISMLVVAVRAELKFGETIGALVYPLLLTPLAILLTPWAIKLMQGFAEKSDDLDVRSELVYLMRGVFGFGGVIFSMCIFTQFESSIVDYGLIALAVGLASIIVFSCPSIIGIRVKKPANIVDEVCALIMLPVKAAVCLIVPLIAVFLVYGFYDGFMALCDSEFESPLGIEAMIDAMTVPLITPLAVYVVYLLCASICLIYRAVAGVPQKLDDIRKAIEEKR